MHQNTPNLNSNIYFEQLGLRGGRGGGANSPIWFFEEFKVFFQPNSPIWFFEEFKGFFNQIRHSGSFFFFFFFWGGGPTQSKFVLSRKSSFCCCSQNHPKCHFSERKKTYFWVVLGIFHFNWAFLSQNLGCNPVLIFWHIWYGMPRRTNSAIFFNIVQKSVDPPPTFWTFMLQFLTDFLKSA